MTPIEAVARAICTACEENTEHVGDAQGNTMRWMDYVHVAEAAMAAQTPVPPRLTVSEIFEADPLPHSMFDDERVEFARAIESAVRAHFGVNDE